MVHCGFVVIDAYLFSFANYFVAVPASVCVQGVLGSVAHITKQKLFLTIVPFAKKRNTILAGNVNVHVLIVKR